MDAVHAQLIRQIDSQAGMLRRVLEGLTEDQFARAPGPSSPPIGWHLWHIARWADRFQASIEDSEAPVEVWQAERLAEAWGLDPAELGVLELGMSMEASKAQALPGAAGKERFAGYMERVLDALQSAVSATDAAGLMAPRMSIREYASVSGVIQYAPAQESTLFADVLFHLTHSGRHLGSIEALRGL